MDRKNAAIAVLSLLLFISGATSYLLYQHQQLQLEAQRELIEQLLEVRTAEVEPLQIGEPDDQINQTREGSPTSANIVAVSSDTRQGVMGTVTVELKEGTGNVLVNTNPFVEPDTQYSIREAVEAAAAFTKVNVSDTDILISFEINGTVIGGPSAGAATTIATIAALEGKTVRLDCVLTGTIEEDRSIGQVGGVFDKAVAAEQHNISLFLVPRGQKTIVYYEQRVEEQQIFGFTFSRVYYTPKEIDLDEYMGDSMAVREVASIGEAVSYMVL
ncbi:MAG: S16 family serine protease [Candidatus Methanospirareceae archaeon]